MTSERKKQILLLALDADEVDEETHTTVHFDTIPQCCEIIIHEGVGTGHALMTTYHTNPLNGNDEWGKYKMIYDPEWDAAEAHLRQIIEGVKDD